MLLTHVVLQGCKHIYTFERSYTYPFFQQGFWYIYIIILHIVDYINSYLYTNMHSTNRTKVCVQHVCSFLWGLERAYDFTYEFQQLEVSSARMNMQEWQSWGSIRCMAWQLEKRNNNWGESKYISSVLYTWESFRSVTYLDSQNMFVGCCAVGLSTLAGTFPKRGLLRGGCKWPPARSVLPSFYDNIYIYIYINNYIFVSVHSIWDPDSIELTI